jgi:hypothetical protein
MKNKFLFIILFCILIIGSIWFVRNSSAFIGPQGGNAGDQPGLFITNGTSLKIGGSATLPSTLLNSTKLTVVASSGFPYDYLLKLVVDENDFNSPILSVNNAGGVSIGTNSSSINATPDPNGGDGYKRLYVKGTLVADQIAIASCTGSGCGGGSVAQLSSGVFGSSLAGYSTMLYAFPSSVGVGTSTQVGLPQTLSVYGGGYFSGRLGIGTSSASGALSSGAALVIDMPSSPALTFMELNNRNSPTKDTWVVRNSLVGSPGNDSLYITTKQAANSIISIFRNTNTGFTGVGIKSDWPAAELEVNGNVRFGSTGSTSTLQTLDYKVGIGTSTPSQKLHVSGNAIISDQLLVATTTLPALGFKLVVDGSVKIGGLGNFIELPSSGFIRFGDGTTQSSAAQGTVGGSGATSYIPKWTAGSTLGNSIISETAGGNIGVGIAGATYKLDVAGTLRATGNAVFSGSVGIGTTNPGVILDLAPTDNFPAIRFKKDSTYSWGVNLIVKVGATSGNSTCGSGYYCVAAFNGVSPYGSLGTCSANSQTVRALCAFIQ